MAVGQIIGKVAVRVIPDTKDFRKEAERKLSAIEKALKIEVRVVLDQNQMKQEALKMVRDVNRVLKSNSAYHVKFAASISRNGMAAEIRKAQQAFQTKAKHNAVKFDADVAAAIISGSLDQESMKKVAKELRDWRDEVSPLKVGVTANWLPGGGAAVSARLAVLTRPRTVAIFPILSPGATTAAATAIAALAGGRALKNIFSDLWDSLKNLDKAIPKIGSIAFAILGLGGYAMSAAGNLFSLSSSLAQIGPAALALPGILGGLAIGLGATFVVLKDFGDYLPGVSKRFSKLQDAMSVNFWHVAEQPIRRFINTLFPQFSAGLQDTSTELGGFFANLSGSMSGQFNGALGGMFDDLSESILVASGYTDAFATILRILGEVGAGYLPRLAEWFGTISEKFSNFLDRTQKDGSLVGWIDRGIFQLQELGRALYSLGSIFGALAKASEAAGGSTLTMMADTLERVANVVHGDTFQGALIGVLEASYKAMNNIATIAGPAMEDFFVAFSATLESVLPKVGKTIGVLGDALFSALANPAVQTAFSKMIDGLAKGFQSLAPTIESLAPVFATLMEAIGALGANLGPVLAAAFGALAPAVNTVGQALIPLINMLGPILTQAITALSPLIQVIGEKLAEIAVAAQPLVQRLGELIALIMPVLVPALGFLAGIIGGAIIGVINGAIMVFDGIKQAVQGFVQIFQGVIQIFQGDVKGGFATIWEGIKNVFKGAFTAIIGAVKVWLNVGILGFFRGGLAKLLGLWKGGWQSIKAAGTSIWNAIRNFFQAAFNAYRAYFGAVWNGIKQVFAGVWQAMKGIVQTVWSAIRGNISNAIQGVKGIISGALGVIKGVWNTGWSALKGLFSAAWAGVRSAVSSGVDAVVTLVKSIPGKVRGALSGAGSILLDAGAKIISGLISGIDSMIGDVRGKFDKLTGMIPDWKGPRERDAVLLYEAGRLIMGGLIKGLDSKFADVKKLLGGLTNMIPEKASKGLKNRIRNDRSELSKLLAAWNKAGTGIQAAQQVLNDVRNDRDNLMEDIRSAVINSADIGTMAGSDDMGFEQMISKMEDAKKAAKKFNEVITGLIGLGLNDTSVKQLIAAGPEAALATAEAILAQGQAGVNQVDELQAQIEKAANALAQTVKTDVFGDEVGIAEALLKNLQSGRSKIVNEMKQIVRAMMKAIDKELDVGKKKGGKKGDGGKNNRVPTATRSQSSTQTKTAVNGALPMTDGAVVEQKILNYYAAEGRTLTAEEDLFAAAERVRMVGW